MALPPRWRAALDATLPKGTLLPDEVWRSRHRFIMLLLWAHVPAIAAFAAWRGFDLTHVTFEAGVPALLALGAMRFGHSRKASSTLASFGLLSCSAILVHLSGGYIEMHFHFFVMMPIISLYHDWTPFLLAIGYVAVHHGVAGSLDPTSVYNHPDAIAHPWRWALIHAGFILGICAASVYNWRLNESAMERQLASEREASRFSATLLRTAAHELNTPLTPLALQLKLLREGHLGPLTEPQRRSVDVLERNHARLAALIRDVLQAARLRDGRLPVARAPLDLAEVVREVAEVFLEPARQRGVALEVRAAGPLPVDGDAKRLVQVFTNLVGNALKFTPDGGRITFEAGREGGEAVVRVRDSGRGLEPRQLARLFQPFGQADDADADLGTGLGLFISKGIVERHGGRVWAESDGPGRGSVFAVALPMPPPRDASPAEPPGPPVAAAPMASRPQA